MATAESPQSWNASHPWNANIDVDEALGILQVKRDECSTCIGWKSGFREDGVLIECPKCQQKWSISKTSETPELRLKIANDLFRLRDLPKNSWDDILMLYSEDLDGKNSNWLNFMGVFYDNEKNHHFQPVLAHSFYLRAVELQSPYACYNLATRYMDGYYGPKDFGRAEFWFTLAAHYGHGCAKEHLFHFQICDPRFERPGDEEYTNEVYASILDAEQRLGNWDWLILRAAWLYASGRGVDKDPAQTLKRYHALIDEKRSCNKPPRYHAMICMALRSLFGFDVKQDFKVCFDLLDRIPSEHSEVAVHYDMQWQKNKLLSILGGIEKERITCEADQAQRPAFLDSLQMIAAAYSGLLSLENLELDLECGKITSTRELALLLWAACIVAGKENWATFSKWLDVRKAVERKLLGVDAKQVKKATYLQGPRYNDISPYGLPILGTLASSGEVSGSLNDFSGGFVPLPGVIRFKGLKTTHAGYIEFDVEKSDSVPARLVDSDFDVALVLAFASGDAPQLPSLSIEELEMPSPDKIDWHLHRKEWSPDWIGHTDLGHTLYFCDQLIGKLAWAPHHFSCDTNNQIAQDLLKQLGLTGGRPGEGHSGRVCIRPYHIEIQWQCDEHGLSCQVIKTTMQVDGAYTVYTGTSKKDTLLNDSRYENGKLAEMLTSHFDLVAEVLPVFERGRQLMSLLYAVFELQKKGFRLNACQRAKLKIKAEYFKSLPNLSADKLIIKLL